jgi:hypothetical protein
VYTSIVHFRCQNVNHDLQKNRKGAGQMKTTNSTKTREPARILTKRIGSVQFKVAVYFSTATTETMQDKVLRLVANEVSSGKGAKL